MLQGMDGSFICPDCVELASRVLRDRNMSMRGRKGANPIDLNNVPKPQDIKHFHDQYVIGEEEAKRFLSVAVYNHYKRLASKEQNALQGETADMAEVEIEK